MAFVRHRVSLHCTRNWKSRWTRGKDRYSDVRTIRVTGQKHRRISSLQLANLSIEGFLL